MHLEWSNNVSLKPKLGYYTQFKQDVDAEKYVKFSITMSQRSLLTQLRMGMLPLLKLANTTENHYKKEFAFIVMIMSLKMNITFLFVVQHIIQKETVV